MFELPPGVYPQEIDLSERVRAFSNSIGAIVFESTKGPSTFTFYSSEERFIERTGQPKPTNIAQHCAIAFLEESEQLWGVRALNGALTAGGTYISDREGQCNQIFYRPFPIGYRSPFQDGATEIQQLLFDGPFVVGNVITGSVIMSGFQNGIPINAEENFSVTFTTNSDNTLALIGGAILDILNTYTTGGIVEALTGGVTVDDGRFIRITSPIGVRVAIVGIDITGGLTQSNWDIENPKMFDVFVDNPGAWGNNIHTQIANLDNGIPQQQTIQFFGALVAGNVFSCRVTPNVDIPSSFQDVSITFFGSSDATLANIANAILPVLGAGAEAYPIVVGGGSNNDRQIRLVGRDARADFRISNISITGGLSQTQATVIESITREPPDGTFDLQVFDYSVSVSVPVEVHRVSLNIQTDGEGYQLNIDQKINEGPRRSDFIKIFQDNTSQDMLLNVVDVVPRPCAGGDDGLKASATTIINAYNQFASPRKVSVRIIIGAGYSSPEIQKALVNLAQNRRDCMAVIEVPSSFQRAQDAYNYRINVLNVNSSYGALYSPDLRVKDRFTDAIFFLPPSGHVAGVYARVDRIAASWFAPAGLTRGDLSTKILGVRVEYDEGDQQLLFPKGINYILNMPGKGLPIFSAETLQYKASALSNINVRRLLIGNEVALVDSLLDNVFDGNTASTRFRIRQKVEAFLQPILDAEGLYAFEVVCDERNNPPAAIDEGTLTVDDYVQPVIPAKRIRLRTFITRTGANFQELIDSQNT